MQMVDVIGGGVAGEAEHGETAPADFAQLLHASRPPRQHRSSLQPEALNQVVGGFRRACVRSWEYLGVGDQKPLVALQGVLGQLEEGIQLSRF